MGGGSENKPICQYFPRTWYDTLYHMDWYYIPRQTSNYVQYFGSAANDLFYNSLSMVDFSMIYDIMHRMTKGPNFCPSVNDSSWLDAGNKGCFYFGSDANTPTQQRAQDYCQNLGPDMWLAEIHDQETHDLVAAYGSRISRNFDWWLGA